jgi:uncharacterized damage-inducible protein DinB
MHKMKPLLTALLLLSCAGFSFAQTMKMAEPATLSGVLDRAVTSVEKEFVPAAEAMPADKYSYAPTSGEFKGVRTFAQEVKHVATANFEFGAVIMGEKSPVHPGSDENGPDSVKSPAEILKYLKDSFAYLHKAIATINAKNDIEPIKAPWGGTVTRLQIAVLAAAHPWDHYGQMVEYLRSNGIVPPASRH